MLVSIASYPRSGNSFFRIALHRLFGWKSIPARDQPRPTDGARSPWHELVLWTDQSDRELAAADETYFAKTHSLPDGLERDWPAIYLVRDGRDALVSYAWFTLSVDQHRPRASIDFEAYRTTLYNLMMDRRSPYGVWSENVRRWMDRPNTALVGFERLIRDPRPAVDESLESLRAMGFRIPLRAPHAAATPAGSDSAVPGFDELRALQPHHYRRGGSGGWRDEFPADLLELFWREHGEAMRAAGYAPADHAAEHSAGRGGDATCVRTAS